MFGSTFVRVGAAVLLVLAAGCATATAPAQATGPRAPRDIRQGYYDSAVQAVERDVSREEVAATISAMLANVPVCMRIPGLWLDGEMRHGAFVVRYDLMQRDWGGDVAAEAKRRMDEFVEMGFLDAQGEGETQYAVTALGQSLLRGSFETGNPPSFCGPAPRRLIEITDMEWGAFDCGTLRVRFTHDAESWPSWATSETARNYVVAAMPAPGETAAGSVSLLRQWFADENRAQADNNGGLRSLCYYAARRPSERGDLNLRAAPR